MKQENTTTFFDELDTIAIQASVSTLKKIEASTGDDKIRKLLQGLREDIASPKDKDGKPYGKQKVNNEYYVSHTNYSVSDGYDIKQEAYCYLLEAVEKYGITDTGEIFEIEETRMLKGGKEKTRTLFQWACVAVRAYIYRHGQTNYKNAYIEDLRKEDEDGNREDDGDTLRRYIKICHYYDIPNFESWQETNIFMECLQGLTERQKLILHYRRQGKSVCTIAEKLRVSQPAVSKQLLKIQAIVTEKFPDKVVAFKEHRATKASK